MTSTTMMELVLQMLLKHLLLQTLQHQCVIKHL